MSVHDNKEPHEIAVCRDFLRFYNAQFNSHYEFVRHGRAEDKEPDCICSDGLNIEIVNNYYEQNHAKILNQFARGEISGKKYNKLITINNPDLKAFSFLEQELKEKEKKEYKYDGKLFLLVDVATTHATLLREYEKYLQGKKYSSSVFNEIWLRTFINGSKRNAFLKIFPPDGAK